MEGAMKALLVLVVLGIGAVCWWLAGPVGLVVGLVTAVVLTAQQQAVQSDNGLAGGWMTLALIAVCMIGAAALTLIGWVR